jgi:transporter family-2 protein
VILLPVKLLPILIAAIAGITMAMQGTLNSLLSKAIGLLETTFWVQLIGAIIAAILLFVLRLGDGNLLDLGKAPWYSLVGGLLGVAITFFVASSISKVGATAATVAIIVGQVTTAGLLDHFGLFGLKSCPFTFMDAIGIVLLALGARLLLR